MTSISSINGASAAVSTYKCDELSSSTKQKLEALGIDPASVTSEAQAQALIAQAEATKQQQNSRNKTVVCGDVVFFFKISYNNYIRHKNIPMEVVIFRVYARYGG